MEVQPDGKILIGAWTGLVRLHTDGTIDRTFDSSLDCFVDKLALQPDGKIIILGPFTWLNTSYRPAGIARLQPNGSIDTTFLDKPTGLSRGGACVAVQFDGKILIGGDLGGRLPGCCLAGDFNAELKFLFCPWPIGTLLEPPDVSSPALRGT